MKKFWLIFSIITMMIFNFSIGKCDEPKIKRNNSVDNAEPILTPIQQELYKQLINGVEDAKVLDVMKKHVNDEFQIKLYQKLKTEGKDKEYIKGWHNEIIWAVGDKNEKKKLLPELIEDIRRRMDIDDLPYKEASDDTFRKLSQIEEYPEVIELYCEIIEKCKNSEAIINAIYGLREIRRNKNLENNLSPQLKTKVLLTFKQALNHKTKRVRVVAASVLIKYYGEKKEVLPILIEIASIETLDSLDKEFPDYIARLKTETNIEMLNFWQEEFMTHKKGVIVHALNLLSHYEDDIAIKTIQKVSIKGANEEIRNKAKDLLKELSKNEE